MMNMKSLGFGRRWVAELWVLPVVALFAGLSACSAGSGGGASPTARPARAEEASPVYTQVMVNAHHSWYVIIREDGSGLYGYGSALLTPFPRGTFAFDEVLKQAIAVSTARKVAVPQPPPPHEGEPGWYTLSLVRLGSSLAEKRDTRDVGFVKGVFEKAMAAAPPNNPDLTKELRISPPFPADATTRPTTQTGK